MTDDQIQMLRLIKGYHATKRNSSLGTLDGQIEVSRHNAAVDAIDAALALASHTCGNCGHTRDAEPTDGWVWCHEKSEPWRVNDGCRLGWTAREQKEATK